MAFFHQLCLLLWKNYTLKKRRPLTSFAELTVPLILFLILVTIRDHKPPYKTGADSWRPLALPSAGFVPLLQSFCDHTGVVGKNGYKSYPNASIHVILKDIAEVANTPVFSAMLDLRHLKKDFKDLETDSKSFKHLREIPNIRIQDLIKKNSTLEEFLKKNLSMPSTLREQLFNASLNGEFLTKLLLENNEHIYKSYIQSVMSGQTFSEEEFLRKSSVAELLFDPTSLTDGPTWMRALLMTSMVSGITADRINFQLLEDEFKQFFLNASELSVVLCNATIFDELVVLKNNESIDNLQEFFCGLNETDMTDLSDELQESLNWTSVIAKMKVRGPSMKDYERKAERIRIDLLKFREIEDAMRKLQVLSKDLNLNISAVTNLNNNSRSNQIRNNANQLWKSVSPFICGSTTNDGSGNSRANSEDTIKNLLEGSGESSYALGVMLYMLTNDPEILYAPNGTVADKIVRKSAHILDLMKTSKDLSTEWLRLSSKFQEFLLTDTNQYFLGKLLSSVENFPFIYDHREKGIFDRLNDSVQGKNQLDAFIREHNTSWIGSYVSVIINQLDKTGETRRNTIIAFIRSNRNAPWTKIPEIFDQLNDTWNEVKKKSGNNVTFWLNPYAKNIYDRLNDTVEGRRQAIEQFIRENNETFWVNTGLFRQHLREGIEIMVTRNNTNKMVDHLRDIDSLAIGWKAVLEPMKLNPFIGFPNETVMNKYIKNRTHSNKKQKPPLLSAIVFDNIKKDGSLPKHIHYRIRMDGRFFFSTQVVRSQYWYPSPLVGNAKYYYFGFAWIQDQLERAMIELMTNKNVTNPGLYVQEIPYPCYVNDNFMFVVQYIVPLCVVISFIYSVALLVQSIVYEKETRLKEVMKMMGLSNAVHWTAWFITSIVTMMVIVVLLTTILKVGSILPASNTVIVLLFLTLAAIATIMFCFLVSIFFSKAKLAAACGGIIYFVTYMPYVFISVQEGGSNHMHISANFKTIASLFSTTAVGLGARYFALFEQNGIGIQWSNIATSPLENDSFNMAHVFTMLIVDTFIYAIFVWYIEAIHPGTYGIPRKWYFPFQLSYWFGPQTKTDCYFNCYRVYNRIRRQSRKQSMTTNTAALLAVEDDPVHLTLGVAIDNLVKIYKKGSPPAVDNLSLNLYEGQITSFLGHNGAGKTTTMSLLTGLFPATSGSAYIYGDDIHTDMDKVRRSLGLCPQHNVLYNKMTVEEHLWFYARLKGMTSKQVEIETTRILEDVGLPEKKNNYVETLSGGMKRKLSVAMAFVGGSRTVILDEPTAGVDPYARRAIWDLLAKYKDGRTILLSTHFMDEADILGDRIAIISHGKLRCVGSSLFLKTKFGDGYHLTLVKEPNSTTLTEAITKFIKIYVPSACLICETQHELSYVLPDKGKEKKNVLENLFNNLEKSKQSLGIESFGLQDTTLEEVFLKVTEATVAGEEENDLTVQVDSVFSEESTDNDKKDENSAKNDEQHNIEKEGEETETDNITENGIPMTIQSPISTRSTSSSSSEDQMSFCGSPRRPLIVSTPVKKNGHRRSYSTDAAILVSPHQQKQVCAHRRTPSGTYCGHRRALSSDLTFALTKGDINSPESIRKVSSHKRIPSGTSKIQKNIGSESWECHVGATSTISKYTEKWQQFYGLLLKRFHHSRRNLKALMNHILLPGIFVSIAMTVALSQPKIDTYPPLVLSPSMFHPPPYYIPFNNNNRTDNMSRLMEESLYSPAGIGADCVLKNKSESKHDVLNWNYMRQNLDKYYEPFCKERVGKGYPVPKTITRKERKFNSSLTCNCSSKWRFTCDDGIGGHPETFNTITQDTLQVIEELDFETYLLNTNDLYKRKRYAALTFGDEHDIVPGSVEHSNYVEIQKLYTKRSARVWNSNKGFHSMPTFINAMDNAILRASITPEMGNPSAYGITAVSHPLNFTKNVLDMDSLKQGTDAIIAIFVIIAMSFVPASFVVFLVMERTTKAKHIQFVSGVNPVLYWLSNYVWDLFNFMIPAMACMFIFHAFAVPAYASTKNFPAVCALFICYGWSITPMMYPASFIFREASTGYVVLILTNLFLGITCTVTVSILQLFPNDAQLKMAYEVVRVVFLLFPNYCLGRGLMDLAYNELFNQVYEQTGKFDKITSPFEWEVVLRSLVFMISEGIFFFILTLFIEYWLSSRRKAKILMESSSEGEDCDVAAERQRVLSGGADDDVLRLENLTKIYNSKKTGKHLAVNRLCLGVGKGECFGLLGVNGAGKTTTFKMLTGDIQTTAGDAYVDNNSIARNLLQVHKNIGYCPQFDALFDHLTAEEHLYLYARLKGIPELEIPKIVSWLIKKMALIRYAKNLSKSYSGGNKRKLSAAIALIGNPKVVFMDEPTTGMDPGARRFLWNVILSIIREGTKSVVLTSHSMEECEALCTRLGIMVNGQFQCLGSPQHLKNRFGDGYIVVIRIKGNLPDMNPVKNFMEETFANVVLKECHHNVVQYIIPSSSEKSLSEVFSIMEEANDQYNIEDYSVSQTSLDNVFVNFARDQREIVLENDPSFVCSSEASRIGRIRERIRKICEGFTERRPRVKFSQLMNLASVRSNEEAPSLGDGDDEITLEDVDPLLFSEDSNQLAFVV